MNIPRPIPDRQMARTTRKAAYTFIFGNYDDLRPPAIVTPGWDYICFTDDPTLRSEVWDVRVSRREDADLPLDDKKYAMKHMILFHRYLEGYDLSISIGGQLRLNCDLDDLMREYFPEGDDMMICRHQNRDCIYAEAEVCATLALDDGARIDAQMQKYRAAGFPLHAGLHTTGLIARRHDRPHLRDMCDTWWEEYQGGSRRDQLSLNYALWKCAPIRVSKIDPTQRLIARGQLTLYPHKFRIRFDGTRVKLCGGHKGAARRLPLPNGSGNDYVSYIDAATAYGIRGWAADRNRLNTSIHICLYDGDTPIAKVLADRLRSDVGAHLGDDGLHGFTIHFPESLKDGAPHTISIRFEDSDADLEIDPGACR